MEKGGQPVSDIANPWQSPENASVPEKPPGAQAVITDTMLRYLREAAPWLRFIGILGFIGCGFMVAGGLAATIVMFAAASLVEEFGGFPVGLMGLLYVALGVVAFFPARFTYYFGAKIRNYQLSNSEQDLEQAFKNNKSLWKFTGILCIVYLAFVPLAVIGGIVAMVGSVFM
jgi:hypothetical protein